MAAVVAALVLAWLFLAPPQLGGSTSYVVIAGDSMEPLLHADDLAIVKQTPYYEVGDVAAYHSAEIDRLVLHRIVDRADGRLVFQGDNNDFLDPEHPVDEDLEGSLWVNVPRAGLVIRFLQGPVGIALAAVLVLAMLGVFSVKRKRRRAGKHSFDRRSDVAVPEGSTIAARRPPPPPPPRPAPSLAPEPADGPSAGTRRRVAQTVAGGAGILLLLCVVVGAVAVTRPSTVEVEEEVFFDHAGVFEYSASVPRSSAYDGPRVATGEPIFLRLVDEATFSFDYSFSSETSHDVSTEARMEARLGAENGLSRSLPLSTTVAQGDEGLEVSGSMPLEELRDIVNDIERETGVEQGIYTVTLVPEIHVSGTLGSHPLETTYAPALALEFDSMQLRTPRDTDDDEASPFAPQRTESVEVVTERPNQVVVFDRAVDTSTLERLAGYGGGAAGLILVAALVVLLASRPKDEPARIAARYGSVLIAVAEAPSHADVVDVTDFRTLVRLAEQFETAILHRSAAGEHAYMVPNDGILYRYRTGARKPGEGPTHAHRPMPAPPHRKAQ